MKGTVQPYFADYYKQWIEVYKKDAIREATLAKYTMTHKGREACSGIKSI